MNDDCLRYVFHYLVDGFNYTKILRLVCSKWNQMIESDEHNWNTYLSVNFSDGLWFNQSMMNDVERHNILRYIYIDLGSQIQKCVALSWFVLETDTDCVLFDAIAEKHQKDFLGSNLKMIISIIMENRKLAHYVKWIYTHFILIDESNLDLLPCFRRECIKNRRLNVITDPFYDKIDAETFTDQEWQCGFVNSKCITEAKEWLNLFAIHRWKDKSINESDLIESIMKPHSYSFTNDFYNDVQLFSLVFQIIPHLFDSERIRNNQNSNIIKHLIELLTWDRYIESRYYASQQLCALIENNQEFMESNVHKFIHFNQTRRYSFTVSVLERSTPVCLKWCIDHNLFWMFERELDDLKTTSRLFVSKDVYDLFIQNLTDPLLFKINDISITSIPNVDVIVHQLTIHDIGCTIISQWLYNDAITDLFLIQNKQKFREFWILFIDKCKTKEWKLDLLLMCSLKYLDRHSHTSSLKHNQFHFYETLLWIFTKFDQVMDSDFKKTNPIMDSVISRLFGNKCYIVLRKLNQTGLNVVPKNLAGLNESNLVWLIDRGLITFVDVVLSLGKIGHSSIINSIEKFVQIRYQ